MYMKIALVLWMLLVSAWGSPSGFVPLNPGEFGRDRMVRKDPEFLGLQMSRFQMQQTYSMAFTSSSFGSQSAGLYLNTMSYQIATPLRVYADVGVYNMFSQSGPISQYNTGTPGQPELILPRVGIEYRPTDNVTIMLEVMQGNDAQKAYGSPYSPYYGRSTWRRHRDLP
jgi:hypothetical protein